MEPTILILISIPFILAFIVWIVRLLKHARKLKDENDMIYIRELNSDDYIFM